MKELLEQDSISNYKCCKIFNSPEVYNYFFLLTSKKQKYYS